MKNIKTFTKFYESLGEVDSKWNEIRSISSENGVALPESPDRFNFTKTIWGDLMKFILFGDFKYNVNFIYPDASSREFKEQPGHLATAEDIIGFYHEFFTQLEDLDFLDSFKNMNVESFELAIEKIYEKFGDKKLSQIAYRLAGTGQTSFDAKWIFTGDRYGERKLSDEQKNYLRDKGFDIV